jgi:23S rRNA maturation-related 3'-5' exoribonuclease YhaM
MHDFINGDGWNKDNDQILNLLEALRDARDFEHVIRSHTVESSYGSPVQLVLEAEEILDQLKYAVEELRRAL